jgi:hypothetical protein
MAGLKASEGPGYTEVSLRGSKYWIGKIQGGLYQAEGLESDALVLSRTTGGLLALRATILREKVNPIFKASAPLSCILNRESRKIDLRYSASPGMEVAVFTGWKPNTVRLAEGAFRGWQFKDGLVVFPLPASEGRITIDR